MTFARMFPVTSTIAAVLLALGCFAGVDDSKFHEVKLADSARNPTNYGVLPLNQTRTETFTRNSGWAAFEITLAAGNYEVRAWGEQSGGAPLDTYLFVYRGTTGEPGSLITTNDDAPGSNEASAVQIVVDQGTYRILVSTFGMVAHGRSSSGTFHVLACPAGQCPKALVDVPTVPDAPRSPN